MIESLHIKNFKCFEDQYIPFGRLTLLTGLNSSGKSSVLQSLLLLRQSEEQSVLRQIGLSLNGDYVNIGTSKDALFEKAKNDVISLQLKMEGRDSYNWNFTCSSQDKVSSDINADIVEIVGDIPNPDIVSNSLFNKSFHYLCSERIGPRVSFPVSDSMVKRKKSIGIHGEYSPNYFAVFQNDPITIQQLAHKSEPSLKLRNQIEAWLSEICPGIRLHHTPHSSMDAINLEFSFTSEMDTTKQFRASNIGFGVTFVLSILVALFSSKKGGLILCENPEAFLHPRGQRRMGELMALAAENGLQIIVETHSDHFLNGVRLAAHKKIVTNPKIVMTHYFQRSSEGGGRPSKMYSPELLGSGRYSYWPPGFFDDFSSAMDELLDPPAT